MVSNACKYFVFSRLKILKIEFLNSLLEFQLDFLYRGFSAKNTDFPAYGRGRLLLALLYHERTCNLFYVEPPIFIFLNPFRRLQNKGFESQTLFC